jgi:tetratricopeptide (TPR) repeat protein
MHPKDFSPHLRQLLARYESQFRTGRDLYFELGSYLKIIHFYEEDSQLTKALEACERAVSHHPSSPGAYLKQAQLLMDIGRSADALPIIRHAKVLAPGQIDTELLYAEAVVNLGKYEEALKVLEYLKEEADAAQLSDVFLIESLVYEQEGQYERMFYTLKSAVNADLTNEEALHRLGGCVNRCKRYQESIDLHEALLDRNAYLPVAWYNLAQARIATGAYEQAIEAYEFAFAIEEGFVQALRECADLCTELQQYHRALKYYLDLLETEGAEAESELYSQIGSCYMAMNRPQAAVTYFLQAARHDPMSDETFFNIGNCYALEGFWSNAVQYFEKAIGIDEERDEYFAALGEACFHLQDHEQAIDCMQRAIEINDMESSYWKLLAAFLINDGQEESALQVLEEGSDILPGTEILYSRIACLFAIGRRQEACQWLAQALEEDFEQYPAMFDLIPELEEDPDVLALISIYTV